MAISTRQVKNKRDSNGVLTGRPGTVYDVNIKYTAPDGKKKSYAKKGFATKKEALGFERDFLEKQSANPDMTFQNLYEIYMEDMAARLKQSTLETKCQGLFSIPTIHCMRKATVDFTLQWLLSTYN